MKRFLHRLTTLAFLTIAATVAARTWKSADGRTMEAEFVARDGDNVVVLKDGKKISLPLAKLSTEDQQWVAEQAAQPSKPDVKPMPATPAAKPLSGPYAELLTGDWALSKHKDLPFALYAAKDLDAAKQYPLVLALHGKSDNNENGKQVAGWMKVFTNKERYEKNPCILVAPLCYQPFGGTGGGWNDKPGTEAISLVEDLVKKLPLVDKNRIYVIGHSMGGFGTCHLINKEPRLFAAGIPVAGCSSPSTASNLRKVSLWLHHAKDDSVVKVDGSRDLAKALEHAKSFKYTEYETGGHGVVGKVFDDDKVHEWLFQQNRKN